MSTNETPARSDAWRRGYETWLEYWVADGKPPTILSCPAHLMLPGQEREDVIAGWNQAKREAGYGP